MKFLLTALFVTLFVVSYGEEKKKKKDITFYTDADMERLFEEWEEKDEDELEEDELPPHKRQQKPVDMESLKAQAKNPEDLIRLSKKGQTLMMFVGIVDPSDPNNTKIRSFTEHWTSMWQSALYNNHVDCQVFVIDDNRAIFMFREGSQAFEAKNYLIKQSQVTEVTLEGSQFPGEGAKTAEKIKKEL